MIAVLWMLAPMFLSLEPVQQPQSDPRLEEQKSVYEKGDKDAAVLSMRRHCESSNAPMPWLQATSYLLNQKNDAARATPFAQKAFQLLPDSPDVVVALGFCYVFTDKGEEAEKLFREAERKFKDHERVLYGLAAACALNRKLTEAQERYVALARAHPDHALYQFVAGENSMKLHLYDLAEEYFRGANTKGQRHPDAAWKLAQVLGYQKKDEAAERLFRNVLEHGLAPSRVPAAFQYAVFLQERKRAAEAIPLLKKVLESNPEHRMAWNYLSRCLLAQGDKEAAREGLKKYRELQIRAYREEEEYLLSLIREQLKDGHPGEPDSGPKRDRP